MILNEKKKMKNKNESMGTSFIGYIDKLVSNPGDKVVNVPSPSIPKKTKKLT